MVLRVLGVALVMVALLASAASSGGGEGRDSCDGFIEENPDVCDPAVADGGGALARANSHPACDSAFDGPEEFFCACDDGFADTDEGCLDPLPFYEECCACLDESTWENDVLYEPGDSEFYQRCTDYSAVTCVELLTEARRVPTGSGCTNRECAVECRFANCNSAGCEGW